VSRETARQWLTRAGCPELVECYDAFRAHVRKLGSKERRSLWDLCAGIHNGKPAEDLAQFWFERTPTSSPDWWSNGHVVPCVVLLRGDRTFLFIVIKEACDYRGVAAPKGALVVGCRPRAHRTPQVKKWGRKLRK
jgi:hypothetical protein